MPVIRIGNAAGFWGDSLAAPRRMVESTRLDYLTLEYLAELTMSILAHQRAKNNAAGYVTDFPLVLKDLAPALARQSWLRIVTNAGGVNPQACAAAAGLVLTDAGLGDVRIGIVEGDELLYEPDIHNVRSGRLQPAARETFAHLDTGEPIDAIRDRIVAANAYLGAGGIVESLSQGARIVITGRVADASLTVGPAVFEHGWSFDDLDRLAQASVAGHLIECGAQVTGGMFSGWTPDVRLADIGYPVAEIDSDGAVVITKPEGSGGQVTIGTVSEQLVYEIGDPAHYLTPDVDVDFTGVHLADDGPDRVRVSGARGHGVPERLKVSIAYDDGWMADGTLVIAGPQALLKARACADVVLERARSAARMPARTNAEYLGAGECVPGIRPLADDPPEVVLRLSAHDPSREAVERFVRELVPLVTSGPPGVTGYAGARPKPRRVLAYWPTTIARERIETHVTVLPATDWIPH
ncbi:MAG: DUF1446 domain-containing protein [Planctomycetes bacterium]|nr:DUF1446 domain-containing protein [Planctomycetota bacterium]